MANENEATRGSMTNVRKAKIGLAVICSVIILVLIIQNRGPVTLNLLFWNFPISLALLIPFVFLTGMVSGYVLRRR